jgi:hypothetical protein
LIPLQYGCVYYYYYWNRMRDNFNYYYIILSTDHLQDCLLLLLK